MVQIQMASGQAVSRQYMLLFVMDSLQWLRYYCQMAHHQTAVIVALDCLNLERYLFTLQSFMTDLKSLYFCYDTEPIRIW